jgi:hypothetical protein
MKEAPHHHEMHTFPAQRTPPDRAELTGVLTRFGAIYAIRFRPDEDGVEAVHRRSGDQIFAATPGEMGQILADLTGDKTWPPKPLK